MQRLQAYIKLRGRSYHSARSGTSPTAQAPSHPVLRTGLLLLVLSGCATYRLGAESLYRPDLRSVAVPVIQSESFRPFLGEQLTEAVVKEIQRKTPYRVTDQATADSVLTARIISDAKFTIIENVNDEPRDVELEWFVELNWRDRRGFPLFDPHVIPVPREFVTMAQAVHFVPEGGQSLATAQQAMTQRIAEQIVSRMEAPW